MFTAASYTAKEILNKLHFYSFTKCLYNEVFRCRIQRSKTLINTSQIHNGNKLFPFCSLQTIYKLIISILFHSLTLRITYLTYSARFNFSAPF